jgi:hypothetical protein
MALRPQPVEVDIGGREARSGVDPLRTKAVSKFHIERAPNLIRPSRTIARRPDIRLIRDERHSAMCSSERECGRRWDGPAPEQSGGIRLHHKEQKMIPDILNNEGVRTLTDDELNAVNGGDRAEVLRCHSLNLQMIVNLSRIDSIFGTNFLDGFVAPTCN